MVQAQAARLHIDFRSGTTELTETRNWDIESPMWPRRLAIVPRDEGSGRRFEIDATALDARGAPVGRVRALSSFARGRTALLRLVFEDCCASVHASCTETETCRGCACTPYDIDPRMLPEFEADAGTDAHLASDAYAPPGVDAFAPPDTFTPPIDAPIDAPVPLPDAAPPPILPEGALCDVADVRDHCSPGTVCTCDNPTGCTATAPPARCFALSQINCARPIDLTARVNRVSPFTIELDGSTSPNLTLGTCSGAGPVPDLLYIVRNETAVPQHVNLDCDASYDFWFSCRLDFNWSTNCSPSNVLTIERAGSGNDAIYIFVEADGPSILRVTRTP